MITKKHEITKKIFISTMITLVIAELTGSFACIIDGIVTNRFLGNDAMAAYGIANTYFCVATIIIGVFLVGCQTLVVGTMSKGNKDETNRIVSLCAILGISALTLLGILIMVFPGVFSTLFGASKENIVVYDMVKEYLRMVAIGSPFWFMAVVFTPIVQLDGDGTRAKIASFACGGVDIILDLVFGVWLKMGMAGMGLATAVSYMASGLIVFSHFFTKKSTIKLSFKNLYVNKLSTIIKNGSPRAITMVSRTLGRILLNLIVININISSSVGMTAMSVQRSVSFFFASLGWGVCGTVLMLEEMYYHNKNISEFKEVIKLSLKSIIIFIGILSIIGVGISPLIARLFIPDWSSDEYLYNLAIVSLRYYMLSLPFVAFNITFSSYIQSTGKLINATIINILIECISLVIACFVLTLIKEYYGFFAGFFVGEALLSLGIIIYILIHKLLHKEEKYSLYFIDDGYICETDKILEATISSIDDAVKISESINDFCKDTYLTPSQVYKISLAVEEMATNVFTHGMTKDNKKHHVELRLVVSINEASITVIDDCKKFDITKKLKSLDYDKDNPGKNIGIRMIMLLAKKVIYSNTVNINNLEIII